VSSKNLLKNYWTRKTQIYMKAIWHSLTLSDIKIIIPGVRWTTIGETISTHVIIWTPRKSLIHVTFFSETS
jgi:hypothetical protein